MKKIFILSILLCVLALLCTAYALDPETVPSADGGTAPDVSAIAAELAESIGNSKVFEIISELKTLLKNSGEMNDDMLRAEILRIASEHGVTLTEKQTDRFLSLCRSIDKINIEELKEKAENVKDTVQQLTDGGQSVSGFWQSAKAALRNILRFVTRLFKKYA